jgi:hypothetical protein
VTCAVTTRIAVLHHSAQYIDDSNVQVTPQQYIGSSYTTAVHRPQPSYTIAIRRRQQSHTIAVRYKIDDSSLTYKIDDSSLTPQQCHACAQHMALKANCCKQISYQIRSILINTYTYKQKRGARERARVSEKAKERTSERASERARKR